jgi:hypothetical protein
MEVPDVSSRKQVVVLRFNEAMKHFWRTGDAGVFDEVLSTDYVQQATALARRRMVRTKCWRIVDSGGDGQCHADQSEDLVNLEGLRTRLDPSIR